MSRFNLILVLILAALLIFVPTDSAREEKVQLEAEITAVITPTPSPTPATLPPSLLSIPRIEVEAPIEPVGIDETGKMELPQDINVVGWYSLGYKPGEAGNAVMAGHLDSTTGEGAIFYNLKQVEAGDEIITSDELGKQYKFEVTEKIIYPYDQVPLEQIFGESS